MPERSQNISSIEYTEDSLTIDSINVITRSDSLLKRVIAAKRHDAMPTQHILDLKIRGSHFHEWLGVIAARDNC